MKNNGTYVLLLLIPAVFACVLFYLFLTLDTATLNEILRMGGYVFVALVGLMFFMFLIFMTRPRTPVEHEPTPQYRKDSEEFYGAIHNDLVDLYTHVTEGGQKEVRVVRRSDGAEVWVVGKDINDLAIEWIDEENNWKVVYQGNGIGAAEWVQDWASIV